MRGRKIKKFMENIENYQPKEEDKSVIGNLADKYLDKSEDEIFVEIIRVKSEMEDQIGEEEFATIVEKIEAIRPMLSEEQNDKLNRILEMLNNQK